MINVAAALPRFGGEIEVYFDFLNRFIKQLKQTDQKMRAAYKNGDIEQLYAISHGLKGTAANFEARAICDLANSLEEVTSNNSLVGAYSLINEISNQIPKVEAFYHNQVLLRKRKAPVLPASVES
jgi:HPt (histidine-containing phosphotransfer) domain-containing protein